MPGDASIPDARTEAAMRRPGLWIVLILGSLGADDAPGRDDSGFVPLFDGKSLAGWTRFGGKDAAWAVDDGRLVSVGEGGGWLGTTREYADFILRLEFRLAPGAN